MRVHLPSGRVIDVPRATAAATTQMSDFCPRRDEHTAKLGKRYRPTVHPLCGFAVVYVAKAPARA